MTIAHLYYICDCIVEITESTCTCRLKVLTFTVMVDWVVNVVYMYVSSGIVDLVLLCS